MLSTGGKLDKGWFGNDIDFGKGILDPALRLDDVAYKVAQVRQILQGGKAPKREEFKTQYDAAQAGAMEEAASTQGGPGVIVGGDTNIGGSTNVQQNAAVLPQTSAAKKWKPSNRRGRLQRVGRYEAHF